jgi:hypothetical protein
MSPERAPVPRQAGDTHARNQSTSEESENARASVQCSAPRFEHTCVLPIRISLERQQQRRDQTRVGEDPAV